MRHCDGGYGGNTRPPFRYSSNQSLSRDREFVVTLNHGFALNNPALVSAPSKKIILQRQLANPGVKRGEIHYRW